MPDRPVRLVDVETLHNPFAYTPPQIRLAYTIAYQLGRGKLVLCALPEGHEHA